MKNKSKRKQKKKEKKDNEAPIASKETISQIDQNISYARIVRTKTEEEPKLSDIEMNYLKTKIIKPQIKYEVNYDINEIKKILKKAIEPIETELLEEINWEPTQFNTRWINLLERLYKRDIIKLIYSTVFLNNSSLIDNELNSGFIYDEKMGIYYSLEMYKVSKLEENKEISEGIIFRIHIYTENCMEKIFKNLRQIIL